MTRVARHKCAARRVLPPLLILLMLAAAATTTASAQTSRPAGAPAPAPPPSAYDGQLIKRSGRPDQATTRAAAAVAANGSEAPAAKPRQFVNLPRVLLSLGIVLGIVFAMRWVVKRFFPGVAGGRNAGVVRVLSRSPVTPKQQVLLVQVGRRVLVVADNGTQMNALSEITDADEVAALIGQVTGAATAAAADDDREAFNAALGDARKDYEPAASSDDPPAPERATDEEQIEPARDELQGLAEKVRGLARQLGR